MRAAANELIKTCDLDIAKAVEHRLASVEKKFLAVQSRSKKRSRDLEEVNQGLQEFKDKLELCTTWVQGGIQKLDSKDLAKLPSEDMTEQLDKLASEKKQQEKSISDLKAVAERLVNDPRTGETGGHLGILISRLGVAAGCAGETAEVTCKELMLAGHLSWGWWGGYETDLDCPLGKVP